jgi:hypothetical protein
MLVKADRSTYSFFIYDDSGAILHSEIVRWLERPDIKPESDLQRKYLAMIEALTTLRTLDLHYDSMTIEVEGKLINRQLNSRSSTQTAAIAELRSELIGLMTRMGVILGQQE